MAGKKTDVDKNTEEELEKKPAKKQVSKSKPDKEPAPKADKTPAFNSVIPPKADAKTKTQSKSNIGISRASAVLLALLAAITGGAIGWLGPTMFRNTGVTDALDQTVQAIQVDLKSETSKRMALETALESAQQSNTQTTKQLQESISLQKQQLTSLSERNNDTELSKIISNQNTLKERLDAQEALSGQTTDEGELNVGAQVLLERIANLETQLTDLQNTIQTQDIAPEFPKLSTEPINLPHDKMDGGLSAQERDDVLQTLIKSFPRDKMLVAVQAQAKIASKKPSWLQNVLSRHVKVRDDNTPALTTINTAETALKNGQIEEALVQIKKLNPPIRVVAKEWVAAATKAQNALNTIDNSNSDER